MIWEWKSCSIVMLTELEERGQVSSMMSWAVGDSTGIGVEGSCVWLKLSKEPYPGS